MHECFIQEFRDFQKDAYAINEAHGFNNPDHDLDESGIRNELYFQAKYARKGLKIALIMSELGEMLEGVRKGNGPDSHIPGFSVEEAEAADVVIRLMNLCYSDGIRLAEAIVAKNEYNRNRPYKHGNKAF